MALASWPRRFILTKLLLRFSDFKTNEYANLIGGKAYEPEEENPMIGWRGATRYYDPNFEHAFALECRAVKKVREEMGLWNLETYDSVLPHAGRRQKSCGDNGQKRPDRPHIQKTARKRRTATWWRSWRFG